VIEFDIRLPSGTAPESVPELVETVCANEMLIRATRGTLATFPGCTHWHYKRAGVPGTLEITWWPKAERLWFKVAEGRDGPWLGTTMPRLKRRLEEG